LDARLTVLTSSVEILAELRHLEAAGPILAEARGLAEEMRKARMVVGEHALLKAEARRAHAGGQVSEALTFARKQLALLPDSTSKALSANFPTVEVLQRIPTYSAGGDVQTCRPGSESGASGRS
jgi:hypothetical protein